MHQHTLRKVVGLDLLGDSQLGDLRYQSVVAPNSSLEQTLVAKVVEPTVGQVSLAACPDEGQIARGALFEKPLFQGDKDLLGDTMSPIARAGDEIPAAYDRHRIACADDFADGHGPPPLSKLTPEVSWAPPVGDLVRIE